MRGRVCPCVHAPRRPGHRQHHHTAKWRAALRCIHRGRPVCLPSNLYRAWGVASAGRARGGPRQRRRRGLGAGGGVACEQQAQQEETTAGHVLRVRKDGLWAVCVWDARFGVDARCRFVGGRATWAAGQITPTADARREGLDTIVCSLLCTERASRAVAVSVVAKLHVFTRSSGRSLSAVVACETTL